MPERLDWGLSRALEDPNLGPQLKNLFTQGEGGEFLPPRIQELFAFKEKYGHRLGEKGDWTQGQIEILDNPVDILAAEKAAINQLVRQGVPEEEATQRVSVGIKAQTRWGVSICDAVKFPNGALGTYVREISWPQLEQGLDGIAVIPVLEDGRVTLTASYRHATRKWGLEIPKGGTDPEGIATTIKRELSEEAGVEIIGEPELIGHDTPDNGILASKVPVYFAKVRIIGQPIPEESEAIGDLVIMTKAQLQKALADGQYTDSNGRKYDLTDSFTQIAFTQALTKGLI